MMDVFICICWCWVQATREKWYFIVPIYLNTWGNHHMTPFLGFLSLAFHVILFKKREWKQSTAVGQLRGNCKLLFWSWNIKHVKELMNRTLFQQMEWINKTLSSSTSTGTSNTKNSDNSSSSSSISHNDDEFVMWVL